MKGLYDQIAHEYYEPFHKTSRNFDETTKRALADLKVSLPDRGLILDSGAGRGRAIEFFGVNPERIIQLDSSKNMLTITPREDCLLKIWNDAENLPFVDDQFSCVLGLLCDPYWGLEFLSECHRVLVPKGLLIVTLPDYEWGQVLRSSINLPVKMTRFKLIPGGEVQIPSNLAPTPQIEEMLTTVGFKGKPNISRHFLPTTIQSNAISSDVINAADIKNVDPYKIPIVTLLRITK